jgi:hypothetical protein
MRRVHPSPEGGFAAMSLRSLPRGSMAAVRGLVYIAGEPSDSPPIPWAWKSGRVVSTLTRDEVTDIMCADPVTRLLAFGHATKGELIKLTDEGADARRRFLEYHYYGIAMRELGSKAHDQARIVGKGERWIIGAIRKALPGLRRWRVTNAEKDLDDSRRAFSEAINGERRT